jgi:hypothetical protein
MKTITASWMISCALLCGCGAGNGSDGDNGGAVGPANDTYEDGNQEKPTQTPDIELNPPDWQKKPIDYSKVIQGVPLFPDPERDAGPVGEEGNPAAPIKPSAMK